MITTTNNGSHPKFEAVLAILSSALITSPTPNKGFMKDRTNLAVINSDPPTFSTLLKTRVVCPLRTMQYKGELRRAPVSSMQDAILAFWSNKLEDRSTCPAEIKEEALTEDYPANPLIVLLDTQDKGPQKRSKGW